MIESLIEFLQGLPVWAILGMTFAIAFIENLVPPSPSDVLLVFMGSLIGMHVVEFGQVLSVATAGSVIGFITAYGIGRRYGEAIAGSRWVPFVDHDTLAHVERLFDRYHGLIIVSNRFLAGTRAVVAFAAGVSRLPLVRTVIQCGISALVWNALLLYVGMHVGQRWRDVEGYLSAYGWLITGVLAIGIAVWLYRRRRARQRAAADTPTDE
ncbi:MAG: DedA family protein [Bacteroidota bacterium]|jgi:membrane protein DedA with SNARE-associated domain